MRSAIKSSKVRHGRIKSTRKKRSIATEEMSRLMRSERVGRVQEGMDVGSLDIARVDGGDDAVESESKMTHGSAKSLLADLGESSSVVGTNASRRWKSAVGLEEKTTDAEDGTNKKRNSKESNFRSTITGDSGTMTSTVDAGAVEQNKTTETRKSLTTRRTRHFTAMVFISEAAENELTTVSRTEEDAEETPMSSKPKKDTV